jgi:hypothetical protein
MVLAFPVSLTAGETSSAILHHNGGVWVDGKVAPDSSAIFVGEVLETKAESIAKLDAEGSSVLVQPESVVRFEENSITLEHGSVSVDTSKGMTVRVKCITVVPVSTAWTQYDVSDVNGTVHVNARKSDVNIEEGSRKAKNEVRLEEVKPDKEEAASGSANVREGQQASREESLCGIAQRPGETQSGPFHSPYTKWVALGIAGGVILPWVFPHGGGGSGSGGAMSPSTP